ncbi:hypothetical protein NDQ53_14370 [Rossellomorea marisflavi]|uniref:hypothetical protein n=1 Tax=Rossellomorea marisflavi TaxID=189381 RepID=UPI00204024E1|nr:hypothetical protein [Rossellomorea marisflavi]MCM2590484.1 hypothetical protein [Rossellomorea marisflavi]
MDLINFKFSKEKELSELTNEKNNVQSKVQEVTGRIQQVKSAIQIAETELMLDDSSSNRKRVEKLKSGLDKFNKEHGKLQKQIEKLADQMNEMNSEKAEEVLNTIAEQDLERYKEARKSDALQKEIEKFIKNELPRIAPAGQQSGSRSPKGLLGEAGLKTGYFRNEDPKHIKLKQLWEEKRDVAHNEIAQEVEEVIEALRNLFK